MMKRKAKDSTLGEFIFLDRMRYDISNTVTILGCTLWSYVHPTAESKVAITINDFSLVKKWTIETYKEAHVEDVRWLSQQWSEIKTKEPQRRIVVLTHHAPSYMNTSNPKYEGSSVASAFVTEMTEKPFWNSPLVAWGFGHTHRNCDFVHNGVRIVSNQRGYELSGGAAKRTFVPDKIVSI